MVERGDSGPLPDGTAALLRAQTRAATNRWRHGGAGARLRIGLGLGLVLATFAAFHSITLSTLRFVALKTPLAHAMGDRLIEAVLLLQVLVVGLSALLMAFAQLFSSRDTPYLASLPLSTRAIFISKSSSVAIGAGWMPTLVALAVCSAVGRFAAAPALFYVATLGVLLACLLIPSSLAVGAAALAARLLPLHRRRTSSIVLGLLATGGVVAVLWRLQPQALFELGDVEDIASAIRHLRFESAHYLPAGDAALLVRALAGRAGLEWQAMLRLLAWLVATPTLGLVVFALCFRPALSAALQASEQPRAQQGSEALVPSKLSARLLGRSRAAIVAKDLRVFARDPSQWSQGLFILALVAIYLASAAVVPTDRLEPLGLPAARLAAILAYASFTLSGLVLSAVALRFLFTSVSLEGRAAWLLFSAPVDVDAILGAKIAAGFPALAGLGLVLVTGSGLLLGASPAVLVWTGGGILLVTRGLTGLAVGLGGAMPNFSASHPMKVSSGLGGLTFSASAICYVCTTALLLVFPAAWFSGLRSQHSPGESLGNALALAAVLAALLLTVAVAALPRRAAERRLRRGEGLR